MFINIILISMSCYCFFMIGQIYDRQLKDNYNSEKLKRLLCLQTDRRTAGLEIGIKIDNFYDEKLVSLYQIVYVKNLPQHYTAPPPHLPIIMEI